DASTLIPFSSKRTQRCFRRAETCIARNDQSLFGRRLLSANLNAPQRFPPALRLRRRLYDAPETIVRTIVLLTISNIFMTFAWYGHLKYRSEALWKVILASWGVAFFEYCFQVPANRIGSYEFSTAQLKTIQEVITLSVFSVFSVVYLGEKLRWNYAAGFACMVL